ncbi:MAG TPA: prolyl oligopeptidase family serine peptidase [Flavisolibacter sp.]|nr:prolyl oligopeptidase family serine peptidase [Flavisolibacter sp.]
MKKVILLFLLSPLFVLAQKKPLDHSVFDRWESITEKYISNDGKWVVYTINPQEGDGNLYVRSATNNNFQKQFPRGYNAVITNDNKYVVFKIKAPYKDTRDARIKKKKAEDLPKDSIGIYDITKDNVIKVAKVKSFKVPEEAGGWVAYHKERDPATIRQSNLPTQKTVDSLTKKIDSLTQLVVQLKNIKAGNADMNDADEDPVTSAGANEGSDLILRSLTTGKDRLFKNISEYHFNKFGQKLLLKVTKSGRDSLSSNAVVLFDLIKERADTILKGGNDFKNFALTENGDKVAFLAERDTNTKALQKYYELFLYKNAEPQAHLLVDKKSAGMQLGMTVSENGNVAFSKSGNRLFFGTVPVPPLKDTSLIDIDLVKLDIWNYKDDYLQTQQLFNLQNELKRSYLAVFDLNAHTIEQLGSKEFPTVMQTAEGDGSTFVAVTDTGRRVQRQWGVNQSDIYAVDVKTGKKTLVKRNHQGQVYPSVKGKYILLYDSRIKNYFVWDGKALKNITAGIKVPLYDEENDVPADPSPYGVMGWHEGDSAVYIYDRYDVWSVDPTGAKAPSLLTLSGRPKKVTARFIRTDRDQTAISFDQLLFFRLFDNTYKKSSLVGYNARQKKWIPLTSLDENSYGGLVKAKKENAFIYTKENFQQSPNLFVLPSLSATATQLTHTNPQQAGYIWGTAELFKWKTFNGKESTGLLYKPEDFDSTKKYPMLIYFYEKLSDNLYSYRAPSPSASSINVPFFVSRGYLVFLPDISYTKGNPGKDAYNYIVSGAQALTKKRWVDATNIGIQGQSWGGYQVAYLITATNMFKAAWAGAPVVNMTSAYGGIRWTSGWNRQFQYEKTQSRIGATLWERPDLYISNSPLFQVPKIKTPLVIMANDADGAVPWYQGIEMFTAMRRLNKPVWMLNYNGEAHNLVERKNRKDITIRQQQYFDWLLKGEKPAKWITEGVPAVKKGKDWGLELADSNENNTATGIE